MPSSAETITPHPLLQVGKDLVTDLLSTLVFAAVYAATHDIRLSVFLGIAITIAQITYQRLRHRPVGTMQWLSLFLVVVFGGATLLSHNPRFVMLKPTLIYTAVGIVMLKPGWMNRYLPPIAREHGADVGLAFGYVWAGLMFLTAGTNLALAWYASPAIWTWFIGTFPLASKLALIPLQYVTIRTIVRRRVRATRLAIVR